MLKYDVELAGTFPLSSVLTNGGTASVDAAAVTSSLPQPDCSLSVLENFARHHCAQHGGFDPQSLFSAILPSVHSELAIYLFQAGQYLSSAKWAAMSLLSAARESTYTECGDGESLARIAPVLSVLRARLAQLTSEYFELLRGQWFALQQSAVDSTSGALLVMIRSKGTELLGVTRELGALAGHLMQEDGCLTDSALNSPNASTQLRGGANAAADVATACTANLYSRWKSTSAALASRVRGLSIEEAGTLTAYLDGILSLSDAARHLSASSQTSSLYSALVGGERDVQSKVTNLLQRQSSEFCTALHLAGLSGVLEIIDRSLPLLPKELGAALALDGAMLQVEQVTNALDILSQSSSNLDRSACSQSLVVELHGAWSRAFEYALSHGDRFGEALEALLRVAELEEQRLVLSAEGLPTTGVTWRDCLRTLVSQACETGQLGWLCSVPDRQMLGYGRRGLSLSEAVAATLEVLATTLAVPSQQLGVGSLEVNFFECLHVYQLSRRNYHDAARIMHQYVERSAKRLSEHNSAG